MPGFLCLTPERNADEISSMVIGCSSRSAYFVGQVNGMTDFLQPGDICLVYLHRFIFLAKMCCESVKDFAVVGDIVALHI